MAVILIGVADPVTNVTLKAEASANLTQVEMIIAYARSLTGSRAYDGYCQRYVRICYEAAGIYSNAYISSAGQARNKWMISKSKENIPVGAVLYFYTSEGGHSAIYLGNNRMIHARETVFEQEITPGFWNIYAGWGWQAGVEPTGAYVDSAEVLAGDIYVTNEILNIRSGPDTSYSAVSRIAKETKIAISQTKKTGDMLWGKTSYYSYEGWVAMEYCEYLYTTPSDTATIATADNSKDIYSVEVKTAPVKLFYKEGENIDTSGLFLTITYDDETTAIINQGFTVINSKAGIAGRSTVIISYEGHMSSYPIVVLSNESNLYKLGFNETEKVKANFVNSALNVKSESFTVKNLSLLFNSGVQIYDRNGMLKESGEIATGDYAVLMDENNPAVAVISRKGDANGNGTVTAVDYLYIKRLFLGTVKADEYYKTSCDLNDDGKINAADFLSLKRYVLGSFDIFQK